jgi:hypothetical protein
MQAVALPRDPYSEDGSHFRIMLFRHFVTHRGHNPFLFAIRPTSGVRSAHLFLDPRAPRTPKDLRCPSKHEALNELMIFLELVSAKCNRVLTELGIL